MFPSLFSITTGLLTIWGAEALAQAPAITPLTANVATVGNQPAAPWRAVGLPGGKVPLTQMDRVVVDGLPALRLLTDRSYGTLVHGLPAWVPTPGTTLQWRWRLDQALTGADLRRKEGDDAALKVCVLFDMPLDGLPFVERNLLRLARQVSAERLPAATVCYVWDARLAQDTSLANAFSRRVRYIVVDGASTPIGQWRNHQRQIASDFLRLFGEESASVPPVLALAVGADSDNTASASLAYIATIGWGP